MLDIVIPAYNRDSKLSSTLSSLLPQLDDRARLIVIDNASTDQTKLVVKQAQLDYPSLGIDYVRNSVNIGANANILRAFEVSSAKWLWVLGDDD